MPRIVSFLTVSLLTLVSWHIGSASSEAQGLSRTETPPQYTTTPSQYTTTPPEYIPLPDTVPSTPNTGGQGPGGQNPPNINFPNPTTPVNNPSTPVRSATIPVTDPTVPGDGEQPADNLGEATGDPSMGGVPTVTPDQSQTTNNNVERAVQSFGTYVLGLDEVGSQQFVTDFGTLAGQLGFQTEEVDFQTGVRMVIYLTVSRLLGLSIG